MKHTLFFVFISILLITCTSTPRISDEIIAEIDNQPIYTKEINSIVKQELFDELNRIYEIKKRALEQVINIKLLQGESDKRGLPYKKYIDIYTDSIINLIGIDSLYKRYNLISAVTIQEKQKSTSPKSSYGKLATYYQLKGILTDELLFNLRKSTKVTQYLSPPPNPFIKLQNLPTHYRGNLQSSITVTTISDFDCQACIDAHKLYDSIYHEYKDKVKFGYIHYSAAPTFAQLASEAAHKQNKFWEFHDSLYAHKGSLDSLAINHIAKSLSLDINKFNRDIESESDRLNIENSIYKLVTLGIYTTPTIIVNNKLVINSINREEITHFIKSQLH